MGLCAPLCYSKLRDTPTLAARQLAKSDPNRRHISLVNTDYVEETFEGLEEQGDRSEIYLGLGAPSFRDAPAQTGYRWR